MQSSNDSFGLISEAFEMSLKRNGNLILEKQDTAIDNAVKEGKSFKEINDMYKEKEKTKEIIRDIFLAGASGSDKNYTTSCND